MEASLLAVWLREAFSDRFRKRPSRPVSVVPVLRPLRQLYWKEGRRWNQTFPFSFSSSALALTLFANCFPRCSDRDVRFPSSWKVVRVVRVPESESEYL